MNKQRIDYIDLMKGFCIILVVINHCGCRFSNEYEFINDYLQIFRMPLYFFYQDYFLNHHMILKS